MNDCMPALTRRRREFTESNSYREQADLRRAIKKSKLPAVRKLAIQFLVDLWFRHRNVTGIIRPGAEKLAKKINVSLRTARTILKEFREKGFIAVTKYAKGGRKPSQYRVDLDEIRETFAPCNVVTVPGELRELQACEGPAPNCEVQYADDGLPLLSDADFEPLELDNFVEPIEHDHHKENNCEVNDLPFDRFFGNDSENRAIFAHGNIRHRSTGFSDPLGSNPADCVHSPSAATFPNGPGPWWDRDPKSLVPNYLAGVLPLPGFDADRTEGVLE